MFGDNLLVLYLFFLFNKVYGGKTMIFFFIDVSNKVGINFYCVIRVNHVFSKEKNWHVTITTSSAQVLAQTWKNKKNVLLKNNVGCINKRGLSISCQQKNGRKGGRD